MLLAESAQVHGKKYGEGALYSDGLSIYSTIDPDMQAYAEKAAMKQVDFTRKRIRQATIARLALGLPLPHAERQHARPLRQRLYFVQKTTSQKDTAADPKKRKFPDETGFIMKRRSRSSSSIMKQAPCAPWSAAITSISRSGTARHSPCASRVPRSSRSSHATAMDNWSRHLRHGGRRAGDYSGPGRSRKTWRPENYDRDFEGKNDHPPRPLQIQEPARHPDGAQVRREQRGRLCAALRHSEGPAQAVPSLALGSVGATLMEMTAAYTVFPNGGIRREPTSSRGSRTRKGDVIEEHKQETRSGHPPRFRIYDGRHAQGT